MTTCLVVDDELCERQVPAADARLYPIMRRYLDGALEEMPPRTVSSNPCAGRSGSPSGMAIRRSAVARGLAIGDRTLQRRLRRYGVDFKGLVDDTPGGSPCAISPTDDHAHRSRLSTRYSEVSAFNRAFKTLDRLDALRSPPRPGAPLEAICAGGGEARQVVVGVPEGLRDRRQPPNVWLIFSSSVMPIPPCSCTASWLTCRAASAILIFAAETTRPALGGVRGVDLHARQRRDRARLLVGDEDVDHAVLQRLEGADGTRTGAASSNNPAWRRART